MNIQAQKKLSLIIILGILAGSIFTRETTKDKLYLAGIIIATFLILIIGRKILFTRNPFSIVLLYTLSIFVLTTIDIMFCKSMETKTDQNIGIAVFISIFIIGSIILDFLNPRNVIRPRVDSMIDLHNM